ncbi:MAG TPA: PspC domain-containing protein [Thermoanaerobaculia bacterium]|nr:PspC domain-containing protein [Thermoanaerobaculia bacterium]HUM31238.1 PspC domain-containing protein [Thermoanaerobaculia bacterium]HXK69592.1 PspC domain-containing protein [Thermoanaerobaculia bacterium]
MADRLYRSRTERVLFGVCGGLGEYLNLDPTLFRVLFIILTFTGGIGVIAYLALALIAPLEKTRSQDSKEVIRENMGEMGDAARSAAASVKKSLKRKQPSKETGETEPGPIPESPFMEDEKVVPPTETSIRSRRLVVAFSLIVVGILLLAHNLGWIWWLDWDIVLPLAVIAAGIGLLIRR